MEKYQSLNFYLLDCLYYLWSIEIVSRLKWFFDFHPIFMNYYLNFGINHPQNWTCIYGNHYEKSKNLDQLISQDKILSSGFWMFDHSLLHLFDKIHLKSFHYFPHCWNFYYLLKYFCPDLVYLLYFVIETYLGGFTSDFFWKGKISSYWRLLQKIFYQSSIRKLQMKLESIYQCFWSSLPMKYFYHIIQMFLKRSPDHCDQIF